MNASDGERPNDGATRPLKPVNLTAAAEPMPWAEACKLVGVSGLSNAAALEVRGLTQTENGHQNDGSRENVYIVIAGFGLLRCEDVDMQCTVGDVLFVPKGCPHRFERLDGEIKIWRISPIGP
jgi:mannose-6-phosphate isomerase-like protein (cupin superfamily)